MVCLNNNKEINNNNITSIICVYTEVIKLEIETINILVYFSIFRFYNEWNSQNISTL